MMKLSRVTAILAGVMMVAVSLTVAGVACAYLTEYGQERSIFATVVAVSGTGLAVIIYLLVSKYCRSRKSAIKILALLALLVFVPLLSMVYRQIPYSRFGLTIYGAIPVPVLDITVDSHGLLWFRHDKSHFISVNEVQPLLSSETEVLVIGTGWDGLVKVDPAIQEINGLEVQVLSTPAAFDLFNRYVSEGRKVALIAHSTC